MGKIDSIVGNNQEVISKLEGKSKLMYRLSGIMPWILGGGLTIVLLFNSFNYPSSNSMITVKTLGEMIFIALLSRSILLFFMLSVILKLLIEKISITTNKAHTILLFLSIVLLILYGCSLYTSNDFRDCQIELKNWTPYYNNKLKVQEKCVEVYLPNKNITLEEIQWKESDILNVVSPNLN